jgi:hypothetical protein
MWDNRVVEKVDVCLGDFTLAVSFRNVVYRFVWAFAGVYGPNSDMDRMTLSLFQELLIPFFNKTLFTYQKKKKKRVIDSFSFFFLFDK